MIKKIIIAALVVGTILFFGNNWLKNKQQKAQKKGVVLAIPSLSEMTDEERERQQLLFDGDTLIRIQPSGEDTTITAVMTALKVSEHPLPKVGEDVYISNIFNGDEYLVYFE